MCGKSVTDLRFDRRGGASGHKRKRVNDAEHDSVEDRDAQEKGNSSDGISVVESTDVAPESSAGIDVASRTAATAPPSASSATAQAMQPQPQSAPNPFELVENALARAGTTPMLGAAGALLGPPG